MTIPYSIPRIVACRNSLAEVLRCEYEDQAITGREFARFVTIVAETLGVDKLDRATLADSLRPLAGIPLDAATILAASHRLAGNLHRLRRRRPVLPWQVQRFPEWVPVHILGVRPALDPGGRHAGALLSMKIMAGLACPLVVLHWWSIRHCRFIAPLFGFSRSPGPKAKRVPLYPFTAPLQLAGMRIEALVDPALSERDPVFGRFRFTDAMDRWNRRKLKQRARLDPEYTCPENFPADFPCHHCVVGSLRCPAGTHLHDYVVHACPGCGRDEADFDPDYHVNLCVDCVTAQMYRQRRRR